MLMHLDIGLPLLSELEQLRRAFWQNYNLQSNFHDQDKILDFNTPLVPSQPQTQSPDLKRHSDNASNHTERNHLTMSKDQISSPDSHANGQQHTGDNHEAMTETEEQSRECYTYSKDKIQTCFKSTSTDSVKNGSKTNEHNNPPGQPKTQHEPTQPLQVNNSLLCQSNNPKRTSTVLWDRSTEDSSFL